MAKPVVAVIGYTGGVGKCLLSAMEKIGVKPFALVRSSTMKIGDDEAMAVNFGVLGERLLSESKRNGGGVPVIADVTASSAPQSMYEDWLKRGISVVAANKGIFAGPEAGYQELLAAAAADPPARLLHETTVGAGLPVLGTLGGLKASAHDIQIVEGVLSGTLAFVLGAVAGGKKSLSTAVAEAKELGYTEPDPRDDLNGMDVARKAVILARVSGMTGIELEAMEIESLVPESLRECSVEEFMSGLSAFDEAFAERVKSVEDKGGKLHYAAKVDVAKNSVTVGPLACDASHPFNNAGPDNMVAITTNFYTRPLVVQGAGAGGDVTATGVLADILQCAYQQK
jgi:homoserine dehydrogenase